MVLTRGQFLISPVVRVTKQRYVRYFSLLVANAQSAHVFGPYNRGGSIECLRSDIGALVLVVPFHLSLAEPACFFFGPFWTVRKIPCFLYEPLEGALLIL